MARKTKAENDSMVPPDAAAPRPRRQTAASRTRRAPAPTAAPPAVDEAAKVTSETASSAAAPKVRRRTPAPQTTRSRAKAETLAAPAASQETSGGPRTPSAPAEPSREAIAALAHQYWQARGGRDGSADEDWLRAERELRRASRAV